MAKTEKIIDDLSQKEITYPYVSARSLRVELSPTKFVWLGEDEIKSFANGRNLGEWVDMMLKDIMDGRENY